MIIQDTRERLPFDLSFYGFDVIRKKLDVGDYSIEGYEHIVSIDRKKSISELACNLFEDYPRFKRELIRSQNIQNFYIVCEFPLEFLLIYPHGSGIPRRKWPFLRATPTKLFDRVALIYRNYGTKFVFCQNRQEAEEITAQILQMIIDNKPLDIEYFIPPDEKNNI